LVVVVAVVVVRFEVEEEVVRLYTLKV